MRCLFWEILSPSGKTLFLIVPAQLVSTAGVAIFQQLIFKRQSETVRSLWNTGSVGSYWNNISTALFMGSGKVPLSKSEELDGSKLGILVAEILLLLDKR
jgi:hypothetical protein